VGGLEGSGLKEVVRRLEDAGHQLGSEWLEAVWISIFFFTFLFFPLMSYGRLSGFSYLSFLVSIAAKYSSWLSQARVYRQMSSCLGLFGIWISPVML
jgi:hypothetical protein